MAPSDKIWTLILNGSLFFCCTNTVLVTIFALVLGFPIEAAVWYGYLWTNILCLVGFSSLWYFHLDQIDAESAFKFLGNKTNISIGHRGGALDAPENTLAAINLAATNGAHGVEIDLEFTEDSVPVILHDADVDRTTNGTGLISEMDYTQAKSLDAAANHALRSSFGHQTIPTLEEAVELTLKLGLVIFLDCKTNPKQTAYTIASLFARYPRLYTKAVVCSFWPTIIYSVRRHDPKIVTALTFRQNLLTTKSPDGPPRNKEWWKSRLAPLADALLEWSHYAWLWYLCGTSLFLSHKDMTSRSSVDFWKKLGIKVAVWTPNETAEKQFFKSLGCITITDKVKDK